MLVPCGKVVSFAILISGLASIPERVASQQSTNSPPAGFPSQTEAPSSSAQGAQPQEATAQPAPQEGGQAQSPPEGSQQPSQPQAAQPEGAAPTPSQAPQPEGGAKEQVPTIVLDSQEVQGMLGKEALSRTGEKMGQIVDVLVDRSGRIRAAIIDFGGFLGVGSRKIAVDWRAVHFVPGGKTIRIILDLTREEVVGSKEYKPNDQITILEPKGELPPQENADAKPALATPDK
ncbi:MAG: PRC-barrel domain-containing protein [Hyphomicrobiales bacterium]|nr:PRC-barrel domain-containing protein [Hyphomicrobiales bacterium]